MLPKRIIPCLDVDGGRVVKGTRFLDIKDVGDPVELATRYERENADELIFLDISASSEGRSTMLEAVSSIAKSISIPFTVGGGIRRLDDIQAIFDAGADKVSINTKAVEDPSLVAGAARLFGSHRLVVAIDAKRVASKEQWHVYTCGGRKSTGMDVLDWARKARELGAGEILLTSMDMDGTKDGYDVDLYKAVSETVQVPVIASGGGGTLEHIYDVFTRGGVDAILAASIFHYGEISIGNIKEYLKAKGLPVRI